ncbi:Transcriptional regulator, GntR [Bacillus cereus]|nr:Transcriptional regulator, GntR [Bacillus cereus]
MEWKLDSDSKIPIYQQVVDFIEKRITYGELPPGSFLPSERKLATQLNVNRSTVTTAYNELRAMGIVESTTGKGTRVSTHMWGVSNINAELEKFRRRWYFFTKLTTTSPYSGRSTTK